MNKEYYDKFSWMKCIIEHTAHKERKNFCKLPFFYLTFFTIIILYNFGWWRWKNKVMLIFFNFPFLFWHWKRIIRLGIEIFIMESNRAQLVALMYHTSGKFCESSQNKKLSITDNFMWPWFIDSQQLCL